MLIQATPAHTGYTSSYRLHQLRQACSYRLHQLRQACCATYCVHAAPSYSPYSYVSRMQAKNAYAALCLVCRRRIPMQPLLPKICSFGFFWVRDLDLSMHSGIRIRVELPQAYAFVYTPCVAPCVATLCRHPVSPPPKAQAMLLWIVILCCIHHVAAAKVTNHA